jgi:hypothetical protein
MSSNTATGSSIEAALERREHGDQLVRQHSVDLAVHVEKDVDDLD